jgi:hypothetical protein
MGTPHSKRFAYLALPGPGDMRWTGAVGSACDRGRLSRVDVSSAAGSSTSLISPAAMLSVVRPVQLGDVTNLFAAHSARSRGVTSGWKIMKG